MGRSVIARGLTTIRSSNSIAESQRSYSSSVTQPAARCYRALSTQLCNSLSSHMASYFAAQLKDMFFGLVERVTGYGWGETSKDGAGAEVVSPTTEQEEVTVAQNIQIRPRSSDDPFVSGGSKPQVN